MPYFLKLDAVTYESVLSIHKIDSKDYGLYQCKAGNALGSVSTTVNLTTPSKPDPPLEMRVVNATHDTITIAWSPGFDGGNYKNVCSHLACLRMCTAKNCLFTTDQL